MKLAFSKGLFIRVHVEGVGPHILANAIIIILNVLFIFLCLATLAGITTWEKLKPLTERELYPLPTYAEFSANPSIQCYNGISVPLDFIVNCTLLTNNVTAVFKTYTDDVFVDIFGETLSELCNELSFPDLRLVRQAEAQEFLIAKLERMILVLRKTDRVMFYRLEQIARITESTNGFNNQTATVAEISKSILQKKNQVTTWYTITLKRTHFVCIHL